MQWPSWALWRQDKKNDDPKGEANPPREPPSTTSSPKAADSWQSTLNRADWSHYSTTQTITISLLTTATTLALLRLYKTYLRRIPTVEYLKPTFLRRRNFYGYVTRVGDGDNFHFFHTPGGKLMGWGWLPRRRPKDMMERAKGKGKTIHVRIAGVDAPELAHFGRPAQPYGQEAIEWLKGFILGKYVRVYPWRQDQYSRVVCSVYKRRWVFFKSDVSLNMLKCGLATVYEAKFGSEFGNKEKQYRAAEERAKQKKIGMWQEPGLVARILGKKDSFESPRDYKTRMATTEKNEKNENKADMAK